MQLIDGRPLHRVAPEMSLYEKIQVIKQVAEALHAAHRQGLIHRDIKPSNIMVERIPDGGLHPYVMDFGLARKAGVSEHSRFGIIEGTARYMAPEQVRGEIRQLDRRSDVYALGVTLYEILAGASPFVEKSEEELLLAVLLREPKPPRQIDPTLPADLEAIVLKCIEKEPAARYDSAKALAEDLGRYLNGDPVLARPIGGLGRLYRRARRHKLLSATLAVAAALLLLQGGIVLRTQQRTARALAQAEGLGQDLKELELSLRLTNSMPLHDVRAEQALIFARMQSIEKQFSGERGPAAAIAHYSLGRGYLSLGDPAAARNHLQAALRLGLSNPAVHYALGRALGELYQRELDNIRFAGAPGWQEQQRQRLVREFLNPALLHFAQTSGHMLESPHYAAGLMAYFSGHLEESITHAEAALRDVPWMYEAELLAADCLRQLGEDAYRKGQHEASLAYYERAAVRYRAAREMGRSDLQVHFREAQLYIEWIQLVAEKGGDPTAPSELALAASDRAIAANHGSALGYSAKAHTLMRALHYRQENGQELGELPDQVIEYAQAVLRLLPQDAPSYYFLAAAMTIRFTYAMEHGQSGEAAFADGMRFYQKLLALKPDYSRAYNDMGCAYGLRGHWLAQHGQESAAAFAQSMAYLERATIDDPDDVYPKYNLVDISGRILRAQYGNGKIDPGLLAGILEIERYFVKSNRADFVIYSYLGQAMVPKLMVDVAEGRGLPEDAEKTLGYLDRSLQLNPRFHETQRGRAEVFALLALDAELRGDDGTRVVRDGLAAATAASLLNPIDGPSHAIKARLELLAARLPQVTTVARRQAILDGETEAQKALKYDKELTEAHILLGQAALLREDPSMGLAAIAQALAKNPRHAEALATQAALLYQQSNARQGKREDVTPLRKQAAQLLSQAVSINPYLRREYSQLLSDSSN
jgi:serine/threonine-protein kinase